jgi:predicted metal-binding protein
MTTWITICDTCKREGWDTGDMRETDGEKLAALIEARAGGDVRTRRHSCLMGCGKGCNVTVQAQGKLCYTLGDFTPDAETAEAIVEWAALHARSTLGQVPYREWPQGVKGHFVSRHPPLPQE